MATSVKTIDRAEKSRLVARGMELALQDLDAITTRLELRRRERVERMQLLMLHYEELHWHALAVGT